MLFCQLSNRDICHLDSVVELLLGDFHFKLIFLFASIFRLKSEFLAYKANLLGKVGIIQEIIESENTSLPLLLQSFSVWYNV